MIGDFSVGSSSRFFTTWKSGSRAASMLRWVICPGGGSGRPGGVIGWVVDDGEPAPMGGTGSAGTGMGAGFG
ncbi:MAG: hypothetical protein HS104_31575 [Polyangiaceae bacterium]|nr:hypothetical protein [Polyangiaceae bacterium]